MKEVPTSERIPGWWHTPSDPKANMRTPNPSNANRGRGRILAVGRSCPCRLSATNNDAANLDSIFVSVTGRQGLSSIGIAVMVSGCSTLERGH